ncbi:T9SS type A sorting domain-containing protein [Epilithonimonas sp.]|uniref:T9SS type A sorting domain-containing protein n=1 Tax=Epilithonimonas sp. TaxID=2894511 RepID=UPI00289F985D|nr:T9SS type A sorting domain-containing protein [Epilithonimonas sp.]
MKRSILIFLVLISGGMAKLNAQVVNFPDENFLEYILLYTSIDANNDGEIQVSEAEAYTGSLIITQKINNVTGIEYFKNISSLTFNKSPVSNVNLSNNKQLTQLFVEGSNIGSLDLRTNNKLVNMDIKNNVALTQVLLGQHPNLQYASLMFNTIETIDVTQCPMLTYLFMASNNLSSIDVTKNPRLAELNLGANHLTSLDVSKNTRLTYLHLGVNAIQQLDVSNNTLLDTFMIQSNPITSIDISKLKFLRSFVMDSTGITTIDLTPHNMLQFFYASYSQLTEVDTSKNTALIYVNAVENQKMKFINVKNGNNTNAIGFFAINSPNLKCIQVDDVTYSSSQQLWQKDATAVYATDCSNILATNEISNTVKFSAYPNPTSDYLYLQNNAKEISIFNTAGQMVAGYRNTKMVDMSYLPIGNYVVKVTDSAGVVSSQKIIKK